MENIANQCFHLTDPWNMLYQVNVLLTDTGELDTSEYTAGLLCGDLLTRAKVVFDYEQRRFAFVAV